MGDYEGGCFTPAQVGRVGDERTCETCGDENISVRPRYVAPYGKGCYRGRHCGACWHALKDEEGMRDKEAS